MSVPELSDMLFKQEYMKNNAQEQAMTQEEIIQQRIEELTIADKLQKATEKISETFANFVAGPIGTFLTSMEGIYTIMGLMILSSLPALANGIGLLVKGARALKIQEMGAAIATGWTAAMSSPESLITGGLAGFWIWKKNISSTRRSFCIKR